MQNVQNMESVESVESVDFMNSTLLNEISKYSDYNKIHLNIGFTKWKESTDMNEKDLYDLLKLKPFRQAASLLELYARKQ